MEAFRAGDGTVARAEQEWVDKYGRRLSPRQTWGTGGAFQTLDFCSGRKRRQVDVHPDRPLYYRCKSLHARSFVTEERLWPNSACIPCVNHTSTRIVNIQTHLFDIHRLLTASKPVSCTDPRGSAKPAWAAITTMPTHRAADEKSLRQCPPVKFFVGAPTRRELNRAVQSSVNQQQEEG